MPRKEAPHGTPDFGLDEHHHAIVGDELAKLDPSQRAKAHAAIRKIKDEDMARNPNANHAGRLRKAIRDVAT